MKDLISVIIPIYNTELYLERCLETVKNQLYTNLDIILVDDGSKDKSLEICLKYCKLDSRFRVFEQENNGVSSARNLGLEVSKGKYILFLDSDDYIGNKHILNLYSLIKKFNADISMGTYQKVELDKTPNLVDNFQEISYILEPKLAIYEILKQKNVGWECVAKMYSKDILLSLRFDDKEMIGEDFTFCYNSIYKCKKIVLSNYNDYYYSIRSSSATQNGYSEKYDRLLDTAQKFESFVLNNYPNEKWMSSFFYVHSCIEILDRLIISPNRDIYKEKHFYEILRKHLNPVLLSSKVPYKFKIKSIAIFINKDLFMYLKRLATKIF